MDEDGDSRHLYHWGCLHLKVALKVVALGESCVYALTLLTGLGALLMRQCTASARLHLNCASAAASLLVPIAVGALLVALLLSCVLLYSAVERNRSHWCLAYLLTHAVAGVALIILLVHVMRLIVASHAADFKNVFGEFH